MRINNISKSKLSKDNIDEGAKTYLQQGAK